MSTQDDIERVKAVQRALGGEDDVKLEYGPVKIQLTEKQITAAIHDFIRNRVLNRKSGAQCWNWTGVRKQPDGTYSLNPEIIYMETSHVPEGYDPKKLNEMRDKALGE